jgi:GNAT superfamily N-acetyltransferase
MNRVMGIRFVEKKEDIDPAEAADLYIELGWGTKKEYSAAIMKRSLERCDIVVGAKNGSDELIGVARALSDFTTTTKILDMLVAPEYWRQGIGIRMMRKIESLTRGTDIYFETERKNFGFAEKCGYTKRQGLAVFMKRSRP